MFKPALTKKIQPKKKTSTTQDTKGNSAKAIDLTGKIHVIVFALGSVYDVHIIN